MFDSCSIRVRFVAPRQTNFLLPLLTTPPHPHTPIRSAVWINVDVFSVVVQVIPSNRLFYGSDPVGDSPYTVTVYPHKPSQPQAASLAIEAWDEVKVSFMPPDNDGGEAVEGYMVEWWPATSTGGYGDPEIQTLKISGDVDGETKNMDQLTQGIYPVTTPWEAQTPLLASDAACSGRCRKRNGKIRIPRIPITGRSGVETRVLFTVTYCRQSRHWAFRQQ